MVVPITDVKPSEPGYRYRLYFVRKMVNVLQKQGQIEPLQVDREFKIFPQDSHGHEILAAAKLLGWDTLLIVQMEKYEP